MARCVGTEESSNRPQLRSSSRRLHHSNYNSSSKDKAGGTINREAEEAEQPVDIFKIFLICNLCLLTFNLSFNFLRPSLPSALGFLFKLV